MTWWAWNWLQLLWKHTNITSINAEQAVKTYGKCVSAGHALHHATLFTRKELTLAQLRDGIFSGLVKLSTFETVYLFQRFFFFPFPDIQICIWLPSACPSSLCSVSLYLCLFWSVWWSVLVSGKSHNKYRLKLRWFERCHSPKWPM